MTNRPANRHKVTAMQALTHESRRNEAAQAAALSPLTRALLVGGVIAGPPYIVLGVLQVLIRPGFDITRHDLSLMSNGSLGWIQIGNFIVTGLLTIGAALGMRQAMPAGRGRRRDWGPLLVAVYGLGLIGAGFFSADPALGFPPGTPADAHAISTRGLLHFVKRWAGFPGVDRGVRGVCAPVCQPGPARLGGVLAGHRSAVLPGLLRHRQRVEPKRRRADVRGAGLHSGGGVGLGVGGGHGAPAVGSFVQGRGVQLNAPTLDEPQ
jgi:Protein of unknown function (DUF998)